MLATECDTATRISGDLTRNTNLWSPATMHLMMSSLSATNETSACIRPNRVTSRSSFPYLNDNNSLQSTIKLPTTTTKNKNKMGKEEEEEKTKDSNSSDKRWINKHSQILHKSIPGVDRFSRLAQDEDVFLLLYPFWAV